MVAAKEEKEVKFKQIIFMKKLLSISLIFISFSGFSQLYLGKAGETSFYSEAPLENITAVNKQVTAALKVETGDVAVKMQMNQFQFPNKLMQEHFNENYMESSKFPTGTFTGKIQEKIDFTKDGIYDVTTKGNLTIHGVKKERTITGKLTIKGTTLTLVSNFDVKLVDHKIDIPTIVFAKIAEVIAVKNTINLEIQK
jgi:polyisoprenoid-binding protein YceI